MSQIAGDNIQVQRFVDVGDVLPTSPKRGHIFFLVGSVNQLYACFVDGTWAVISSAAVGGTQVFAEIPTGTQNGLNDTFTLAHTPVAGTLQLFLGGFFLTSGTDYTRSTITLTMDASAVPTGNVPFIAFYTY